MSEVMLAELLRATPHGRRQPTLSTDEARDVKLSPSEARDEVGAWLGQLQRDAEQAGASPAQRSALSYLRRSFLGVLVRRTVAGEFNERHIALSQIDQRRPRHNCCLATVHPLQRKVHRHRLVRPLAHAARSPKRGIEDVRAGQHPAASQQRAATHHRRAVAKARHRRCPLSHADPPSTSTSP